MSSYVLIAYRGECTVAHAYVQNIQETKLLQLDHLISFWQKNFCGCNHNFLILVIASETSWKNIRSLSKIQKRFIP